MAATRHGSCHRRNNAGVTAIGRLLARADTCVRLGRHRCPAFLEWRDEIELLESQSAARAELWIMLVRRYRTVCELFFLVHCQQLCFRHVLEEISHAQHYHGVTNDQNPLPAVFARDHFGGTAKRQDDVTPALSSGRTMIEFAEESRKFRLVGVVIPASDGGQAVENPEFFFAEALVDDERVTVLAHAGRLDDETR